MGSKGLPIGFGVRVKLEAIRRGKRWLTTAAALERFFAAMPQSTPIPAAPIRTPSQRERDSARTKEQLNKRYGI